jgi:hypothetical protein
LFTDAAAEQIKQAIEAYLTSQDTQFSASSCADAVNRGSKSGASDSGEREAAKSLARLAESDSLVDEVTVDGDQATAHISDPWQANVSLIRGDDGWVISNTDWLLTQ